ncbi:hypothetical protein [Pelosinus baikalensis]|nr:hypothetical protein [Pelosinus baikalensis]
MHGILDKKIEALANKTIGAALEVHSILGPGYLKACMKTLYAEN